MFFEYFLIFLLQSTPEGDEVEVYYLLEECITAAHCSKLSGEYKEQWPVISQYGTYLTLKQVQEVI